MKIKHNGRKKMYKYILVCLHNVFGITKVEYYEELINEGPPLSSPEDNSAFKLGAQSPDIIDYGDFDFIIVGAGSAGSVLATRLSEIDHFSILLLEPGIEESDYSKIPAMGNSLYFSKYSWPYYTTPQQNCCLGMPNRQCWTVQGKAIGGSSAINGLIYTRGNADDYDNWVRLGNPGWSFKEIFRYFIKVENSQIHGDCGYHGKGGIYNVQYALPTSALFEHFVAGLNELNQTILDYNGRQQLGADKTHLNIKKGIRQSTGTVFLDNARQRDNLEVLPKALVIKILIDNATNEAEGVIFVHNDKKFRANARLEVILSAGAYNSPQLLLLSGVGPRNHLEELGIEVIADLPVGQQYIEQVLYIGSGVTINDIPSENLTESVEQYIRGYGPLADPSNHGIVGFLHTGDVPSTVPMLEYIIGQPSTNSLNLFIALLHPKSRSTITLNSTDPTDFPSIDFNLLDDPEDVDNLITGINFLQNLIQTEAFQSLNATLREITICTEFEQNSRSYWECVLRNDAMSFFHPVASTKMGPNRETSVVDHEGRVHGITKLRVVDAGIIPASISGHSNTATITVAEKISDVIKATYWGL